MIKSFCVKTNNESIIDYLLNNYQSIMLDNIFISTCNFKIYKNVIIHYTGNNQDFFINSISNSIADCIIHFYEKKILKRILYLNFFYFTEIEQEKILQSTFSALENNDFDIEARKHSLVSALQNYINENDAMILDGFINFRLQEYFERLDFLVDTCVNNYLIEKEYAEFINLLKIYVKSKKSITNVVHLIYQNSNSILLDENLNIIKSDDEIFNTKYLSDISFSSNDFALNSLLNLLPQKIFIHLIDKSDEFINSLKLIFENRVILCDDCNICNIYKQISKKSRRFKEIMSNGTFLKLLGTEKKRKRGREGSTLGRSKSLPYFLIKREGFCSVPKCFLPIPFSASCPT